MQEYNQLSLLHIETALQAVQSKEAPHLRHWGIMACVVAAVFTLSSLVLFGFYLASDALETMSAFDSFSLTFWLIWGLVSLIALVTFSKLCGKWADAAFDLGEVDVLLCEGSLDDGDEESSSSDPIG